MHWVNNPAFYIQLPAEQIRLFWKVSLFLCLKLKADGRKSALALRLLPESKFVAAYLERVLVLLSHASLPFQNHR